MKYGLLSGVNLINDVSGLRGDKSSVEVINEFRVPVIIMHMPGNPRTMMRRNIYKHVVLDLFDFFEERINFCVKNGLKKEQIIIDPGIGFGKNYEQNTLSSHFFHSNIINYYNKNQITCTLHPRSCRESKI